MVQYAITSTHDENYNDYIELATVKTGITNQQIIANRRRLDPPPALVAYGRILYKNQWMVSSTPFTSGSSRIWEKYDKEYEEKINSEEYYAKHGKFFVYDDLHFYASHQGHMCKGSFSYVNDVTRNEVAFKDGSVVTGELAYKVFCKYQEKVNARIHYVVVGNENFFTECDYHGERKIPFVRYEGEHGEGVYRGTSTLSLRDYVRPVINKTPFALLLAKGYSTVANGWASNIQVHPGNTLRMTYAGDEYSFSIWRERPTRETDTGTVLEFDQKHMELIQWRKK